MSERKGTKALELWCKRLVKDCPNVQIDNMTTSWRDGMAFCALVHHFRPDLIDVSKLKPENIYENNQMAFSIAEKHLGIPALLDPEDMVENDVPDRLSILTYLSQFYQRLGHKVKTKSSETDSKSPKTSTEPTEVQAPIKFGKSGLDKCTACGLPVYLAQRLMVSHKLYHRRCFRCSKCSGHLNPKNYHVIEGSDFLCDSCKNEKTMSKYLNNNEHDQMGMLAFNDSTVDAQLRNVVKDDIVVPKLKSRPSSVLEKINMFEKNDQDTSIDSKISNLTIKDNSRYKDLSGNSDSQNELDSKQAPFSINRMSIDSGIVQNISSVEYKSSIDKFNFLQTQLLDDSLDIDKTAQKVDGSDLKHKVDDIKTVLKSSVTLENDKKESNDLNKAVKEEPVVNKEESNITDDIRIAKIPVINVRNEKDTIEDSIKSEDDIRISKIPVINVRNEKDTIEDSIKSEDDIRISKIPVINVRNEKDTTLEDSIKSEDDIGIAKIPVINVRNEKDTTLEDSIKSEETISVPPRRKKQQINNKNEKPAIIVTKADKPKSEPEEYPDYLNPFSDDEEEEVTKETPKKISTNPFGSSDEEDDEVPPIQQPPKVPSVETSTPIKRLIAVNPFWSDGEEPSTDEEDEHSRSSKGTYSSLATSTPNLGSARRKKARAPPPPAAERSRRPSADDGASISSLSSYNSTAHSDQKSYNEKLTPRSKKRAAPNAPESLSTVSACDTSLEKNLDTSELKNASGFDGKKTKGPAPGLPLPERREVKLQMSPEELQVQLDLLETQQLGLERQGVLIERMIRDKCEGDEPTLVPQEEVEDLVIQLCELVNEKNDLFRKQTELMYIRRQQRLEQEQADIEHEIRIIQSRPAVNRIDSDKAREEQLVARLVQVVQLRDELVQQLDAERRRERQEDLAIAVSIANKRAQRNSDTSSMTSAEVSTTPKKSKVKDKVKKQFKKAKHTLISKKKDDSSEQKDVKKDKSK